MADVREKWEKRETFREQNADRMRELRALAAKNAELALTWLKKSRKH